MSSKLKAVFAAISLGLMFTSTSVSAQAENNGSAENPQWNLMLAGSELQICSSMNSDYCNSTSWIDANEMRTARLFQLTDVRRRETLRQAIWPRERNGVREELDVALREMVDYFGRGVVPEYRFVERLRSRAYLELIMRLSEAEYERVLDNLEMPRLEGLNEVVNLAEGKDNSAVFVNEFVQMAAQIKGDTPTILVVTAGERDSFRAVDSHLQAFEQAGANAQWLPIDIAVTEAQRTGACGSLESLRRELSGSYDRNRVNPARHAEQVAFCNNENVAAELLANADGVFFTGGSANRLSNTLLPEGEPISALQALRSKFAEGELAVGGAGAGAQALVSANMITNGHSREALVAGSNAAAAPTPGCDFDDSCPRGLNPNSLTYEPLGGVGVFRAGIVDTDVGQRGREMRMLRVAADTNTPLAMGIDRDTAVLMNTRSGVFAVQGANSVFFVEGAQSTGNMLAASFHYLRNGSMGRLAGSRVANVVFAEQPDFFPESATNRFLGNTGISDNIHVACSGQRQLRLLQDNFVLMMQTTDNSETVTSRGRCQIYNGVMGVAEQSL
ncbi:cyanophycinase [Aliidiomarina iranensis]|uniref:Cyanophycinase n=1 Tax=Aliidiomarina iranensis TaxID=1434071 RepID=A0A432VWK1_9GAMM|nr:cyanophycinase [Aliidiomarina iranensis]RUO20938.1 cyanophycinase [Aliidiomarina iranensis]